MSFLPHRLVGQSRALNFGLLIAVMTVWGLWGSSSAPDSFRDWGTTAKAGGVRVISQAANEAGPNRQQNIRLVAELTLTSQAPTDSHARLREPVGFFRI